jgi:transposase
MSLKPELIPEIPDETKRVAKAAFPKGNIYMRMRDELGTFYTDEKFVSLFPLRGQPAYSPWRLALVSVMQYVENLSDRQAADAVRARIDIKYALSLELTDPGFDYSVLSEFRQRLLDGGLEQEMLDMMLSQFKASGLLKVRGKQRTDSTHVLASVRVLNRLENVGETLRAALNSLAAAAPEWLVEVASPEWYDRYGKRIEDYHLPRAKEERKELAEMIGNDGKTLLDAVYSDDAPSWLSQIPAIETLRQTWVHQYYTIEGELRLRDIKDIPPASKRSDTPYDDEARYGTKGIQHWVGYKVHVTETCDNNAPRLISHVETTVATKPDVKMTEVIHQALSEKEQLPAEHFIDSGYIEAQLLCESQKEYQVELVGKVKADQSWQAKEKQGYSIDCFSIDWDAKSVTCPQGQKSKYWKPAKDTNGKDVICIRFPRPACRNCDARSRCTRSKKDSRSLTLRPEKAQQQAIQQARKEQESEQWKKRYGRRAGIEGTISQGVRSFGLRKARYIGSTKTHLQHILTAAAINLVRVDNWQKGVPLAKTRISRFKSLQPKAA